MNKFSLCLILNDIRSAQNVGAILRTADAVKASVITCGYTPHLSYPGDPRPPHIADTNRRAIAKTALGAEQTVPQLHFTTIEDTLLYLHNHHYIVGALEQSEKSTDLFNYHPDPSRPLALILGNEVEGVPSSVIATSDAILELPMLGNKESLNVAIAASIALYQLTFGTSNT